MENSNVKSVKTEEKKYLGGDKYVYAEDAVKLDLKEAKDVTIDIIGRIGKSYQNAIKTIKSVGRYYIVEMSEGYTCMGMSSRVARRVPEIGFIARCATEEKLGKGYNDYVKEFTENKIAFDGKAIPQFIDTLEDVKKNNEKAKVKAEKETKEPKKETK